MKEIKRENSLMDIVGDELPKALDIARRGATSDKDRQLLSRVAIACELAAFNLLFDGVSSDLVRSIAGNAFDLTQAMPSRTDDPVMSRVIRTLELGALAACAGRLDDYRACQPDQVIPEPKEERWDRHVFFTVARCWVSLFTGEGVTGVPKAVTRLRRQQIRAEKTLFYNATLDNMLGEVDGVPIRNVGLRLIALYNLAKATELVAKSLMGECTSETMTRIETYFQEVAKAAQHSGDAPIEVLSHWLRGAVCTMDGLDLLKRMTQADPEVSETLARDKSPVPFL